MADSKIDKSIQQLIKMFGDSIHLKKLWSNASPTSTFVRHSVEVDLSGYDHYAVKGMLSTKAAHYDIFVAPYKGAGLINFGYGAGAGGVATYYRTFTATDTQVTFGSGNFAHGASDAVNDIAAIPVEIYGFNISGGQ